MNIVRVILVLTVFVPGHALAQPKLGGSGHGDGANCAPGSAPLGVDANGAVQGCFVAGGGAFSDVADPVVLNTTTKDVVVGTGAVNTSKLSVDGDADQVQLTLQQFSTQTDAPFIVETSAGAEVCTVEPGGLLATAVGFDAIGAVDLDYGSVDVTDHSFTTDGTGDGEVVLPNDSVGPGELDSTTGAYDFGGVTSLEIPNGANPTVNAAGEVAEDTTDEQLVVGASGRVLEQPVKSACIVMIDLAAADDDEQMPVRSGQLVELVSAFCHCQGTCTTEADVAFEYVEVGTVGPTVTAVTGTVDCEDYVTGDSATTLSGNTTVQALDVLRFDVTNTPSPTTDDYVICVNYRLGRT